MTNRSFLFAAALLIAGAPAFAQTLVTVPPAFETVDGNSANYIPVGASSGGTYLVLYAADQLAAIPPGSMISSIRLRLSNSESASWPTSAAVITNYQIRMAMSPLTPATISTTFANNMTNPVLVRSGGLSLASGAYPAGGAAGSTPEAWGPDIAFTTSFFYTGGTLAIEFRNGGGAGGLTVFADAQSNEARVAGVGATASASETSGFPASGIIARLTVSTPPTAFQAGITKVITLGDVTNSRAGTSNTSILNISPRTIQAVVGAAELQGLGPTSYFVGLGYRGGNTAAWPAAAQSFSKYDIQLSKSNNTPAALSDTIAANVGTDATTVHSGAFPVSAGALLPWPGAGTQPAPWSFEIPFTSAYSYRGGPLLSVIRSDGVSGPLSGEVDSIPTANALYGTRVKARLSAASSIATTTPSALAYPVERWSVNAGTVVPLARASVGGGASGAAQFQPSDITYQVIIAQSQLTYLPIGSQITSMALRTTGALGPATDASCPDYEIEVSTSRRTPSAASLTFADNEGADKMLVRDGPLFIPAHSMPANQGFGQPITFSRAFIYQGGDLCITVRYAAANQTIVVDQTGVSAASTQTAGFGKNATGGTNFFNPPVLRFGYTPSVSVPTTIARTQGNVGYAIFYGPGNVQQNIYASNQLNALRIGSVITGVSFRSYGYTTWPTADTNIGRFDITLSSSPVSPQSMSNTFASNIGADAVLVRSGAMTIPARAFPYVGTGGVEENVWFIQFTQPFVYKGGPLSMTIRNDADLLAPAYWDVLSNAPTLASGRWTVGGGPDAATHGQGSSTGALSARFAFVPQGFCPADLNNDGIVDDADFSVFVFAYDSLDCNDPSMPIGCPADLNFDHVVDDADFSVFLLAYNNLLCP